MLLGDGRIGRELRGGCLGADVGNDLVFNSTPEEIIGKPVSWQIANDHKAMNEARNNGVPLNQEAPRSKAQQSYAALAAAFSGKEPQTSPTKARRWFWQTSS